MGLNLPDASPQASVSFLETYPFPAFIVNTPHAHAGPSQSRIGWKNVKWAEWSEGQTLDALLEPESLEAFEGWVVTGENDTVFPLNAKGKQLNLVKTVAPGEDQSNSFCVITSIPTDFKIAPISSPIQSTPIVAPEPHPEPTHLSLDSTSKTPPPAPLSCTSLLARTDWSKTRLGPRDKWSPVIEMMIEVVLRSPTQDALWLGEDFQML
ncbi:hypothetical protein I302_101140 [Kwoniella bestiolae CBS 10118]